MNNYPKEVKMINDSSANMFGVVVDVVEWAEVLIDPKALMKLRNECRAFAKSDKSDKIAIIKVTKDLPRHFTVTVAEIGSDETCYAAAFPVKVQVKLDKNNDVEDILVMNDKHNSFKIFHEDITETIKNHFANHVYLATAEEML